MQSLQSTPASSIWSYFSKICTIPHPSKHEEKLVEWIKKLATEHNIEYHQDEIGNLILNKPASIGFENKTAVILQAHLDMVPQKNSDSVHDFINDSITPIIDGEWLRADNTTLGADNGIGMASCLAVLFDSNLQHGPLEVLLTTDEETGMTGAFGLKAGALKGNILINTDSEQEGELYVGCAGGINVNAQYQYEKMETEPSESSFEITLTGLKGGHSGCDINLGRANALKMLTGVLHNLDAIPFHLSAFEGGSLRNAIPREARAIIVCGSQYQNSLEIIINNIQMSLTEKFKNSEGNLKLTITPCQLPSAVLTQHSQDALLKCLYDCENGVSAMDEQFSDVVQTSSNLGVITQNKTTNKFDVKILVRSQREDEKQALANKISQHFKTIKAFVRTDGNYPGWTPNQHSPIYKVMETCYQKLFDVQPKAMVIHAGLECGLFSEQYPDWDMISFGPTIQFPHSPDEKVNIASVDKYWKLLISTLESIE